jgi:hypothetical protein
MGSAEGAAFSGTEAFVRTGLMTGSAVDAVMAGWNGLETGAALGGALGAIFHQVCFVAGTQVVVDLVREENLGRLATAVSRAEGGVTLASRVRCRTRSIEYIREGDVILSRDQNDPYGALVYRRVEKVYRRLADHLRILRIQDLAAREQTLKTTDDHPYYVPGKDWIKARELELGDVFFGLDGTCGITIAFQNARGVVPLAPVSTARAALGSGACDRAPRWRVGLV